jgi:protoporphyrinogen oxidase
VAIVVEGENPFPDNWIYIHEPGVKLGRVQNFGNWSQAMVGRPGTTCLGLEYFCFEGDGLWSMADADLIELGKRELTGAGTREDGACSGRAPSCALRRPIPSTIPATRVTWPPSADALAGVANLHVVGRNGMHKYNNQDHSMMTAILAVRNLGGEPVSTSGT